MAISTSISGPYFSSGSISFSTLRSNFRAQNIDGSFNTDTSEIKASELRRVETLTATNPVVPDAVENTSISTGSNLKLSQFRGSVKYYRLNQSGVTDNSGNTSIPGLDLFGLAGNWNGNMTRTIRKQVSIAGTVGSVTPAHPALSIDCNACNVALEISGEIFAGGGQSSVNSGIGGTAIYLNSSITSVVDINIESSDVKIWAGGGCGGPGGIGGTGGTGGTGGSYPLEKRDPGTGGTGGAGGPGGNGRGYNQSPSTGTVGSTGNAGTAGETLFGSDVRGGSSEAIPFRYPQYSGVGNGIVNFTAGSGGTGGTGGIGGLGGEWGQSGEDGSTGSEGNVGNSSSGAIFLRVVNNTGGISYSGQSNAGHTNRFYIRGVINVAAQGEGNNFSGSTGSVNSGYYGPVEGYDVSIGNNPNGIHITGPASMYADDNGASGDDANDLMLFMSGQSGNVFLTYQSFDGSDGSPGQAGTSGSAGGAAVGGTNNYQITGTTDGVVVGTLS